MKARPKALLDERDAAEILKALLARRFGYTPEWEPQGAGLALSAVFARYLQAIIQRLNQAPDKNKLAFLDLLGVSLIPAQAARTPVVFRLADNATDARLPAGAQVAARPPPERNDRIIFETERAIGLAVAKLKEVVSLWPGRDQYIDHSAAFLAEQSFLPFKKRLLQDTPHHLYLAHDTLLALAGKSSVDVIFELTTTSTEHLDILWEYWDGNVWREFLAMRPSCDEEEATKLDGTAGLQRSGKFRLQTDCAETSKTTVNGIEAFWVRGRLTELLPIDPAQVLPEVESIRLANAIEQSLPEEMDAKGEPTGKKMGLLPDQAFADQTQLDITKPFFPYGNQPQPGNAFYFTNEEIFGKPGARVEIVVVRSETPQDKVSLPGPPAVIRIIPNPSSIPADDNTPSDITVEVRDVKNAPIADGTIVILQTTKGLFENGQTQIELSTTLGSNKTKIRSKDKDPGDATITARCGFAQGIAAIVFAASIICITSNTPSDLVTRAVAPGGAEDPARITAEVNWEYWDGTNWETIPSISSTDGIDLDSNTTITFTVPSDMVHTKVGDQEGFWVRVRVIKGGFGFLQTIAWTDPETKTPNQSVAFISQPPCLSEFRLGYVWQYGPFHPEHVLTYNDFQYEDRTEEARWPGQTFQPFKPVGDVTPALYLGFHKKLPVDRLGILFDIVEQRGDTKGPALLWQYWDGISWQDLVVEDETQNFRLPGIVSLIGPDDSESLARFDVPLHWLRARLKEDGPPGEPVFNNIYPNAVWTVQQQTIVDEPIGASTGQPNQALRFRQIPVLAGQQIEVREAGGLRANVEWRLIALEIFGGDASMITRIERLLGTEGTQTDIEQGDVRLKRDRSKRVTEVWVRWHEQRHLFFSGPNDRHYAVERARGWLMFGDGTHGKIPPLGAAILARQYRTGGGRAGNVAARALSQLVGPIGGVETVFNPLSAQGGADGETLENFAIRGPQTVRHRGRALAPADYETLAHEASPAVAVARAVPARNPAGRRIPGWVTVLIIPHSKEPCPWPSFGLREQVRKCIEARAPADLAAARGIYITGPEYLAVDVAATVAPVDPAEAGAVETRAREALGEFLHPLRGGPERRGWDLGRDVFLSDVAAVLERVPGIDYVEELALLLGGALQGERVAVAPDRTVVAGDIRLKLKAAER